MSKSIQVIHEEVINNVGPQVKEEGYSWSWQWEPCGSTYVYIVWDEFNNLVGRFHSVRMGSAWVCSIGSSCKVHSEAGNYFSVLNDLINTHKKKAALAELSRAALCSILSD